MVYRAIGLMSGSSLDGLDIVFTELTESRGKWNFEIIASDCYPYSQEWITRLKEATTLDALDYQLLHSEFGHYLGQKVNEFIDTNHLHYQVALIASHGHTTFHLPRKRMTAQLGDGAAIAAETGLPVISDLRALDVAFGGQGAPIVPMGEKLLWPGNKIFLNIGGIANISLNMDGTLIAFDVCPANRVLNMLANDEGQEYDRNGELALKGNVDVQLLLKLNDLDYYRKPYPKSLANSFGTDVVYPMLMAVNLSTNDRLSTYVHHIVQQIKMAILNSAGDEMKHSRILVTGGGAFNDFLITKLTEELSTIGVEVELPGENIIKYKEALVMALLGVLRWRQEYTVLSSVTGAKRDSIGGAVWIGQEA
jgi:anhydro-N-acetylmuramic acid kinase